MLVRLGVLLALALATSVPGFAQEHFSIGDGKACWGSNCVAADGEGQASSRPAPRIRALAPGLKAAEKPAVVEQSVDSVAIQVSQNDKATMDLALNNALNIIEGYKGSGKEVAIEIVAFGPGLHMFRSDTSPVKDRIGPMAIKYRNIRFVACANTQANQSKVEGRPVELLSEVKVTQSGAVHLLELQERGYAYIRP